MTGARRKAQLAFLLGFGISFLPSFGPFAGVLFVLTSRIRLRRGDIPWGLAAVLSAIAVGAHSGLRGVGFGLLQVLGPWAVYRAFSEIHQPLLGRLPRLQVLRGLFAGFVLLVLVGLGSVSLNLAYPTITQAIVWGANPALFAHTVLVVGALVAVLADEGWVRVVVMAIASIGIVAAGSREAAFGLLLVIAFLAVRSALERHAMQTLGLTTVVITLVGLLGFGESIGVGKIGYLVAPAPSSPVANLVRGSEFPSGDWWVRRGVRVDTSAVELHGRSLTEYRVTKESSAGWLRLQQVVPIERNRVYTVSTWVLDEGPQRPGVQGWGNAGDGRVFALTIELDKGVLKASMRGHGDLLRYGVAAVQGHWKRIFATVRYTGQRKRLAWYVGMAPDARTVAKTAASFAGFQVQRGPLSPYAPGIATKGLALGRARSAVWSAAWAGFLERPWLGWGRGAFPKFYEGFVPTSSTADLETPAHAHDLVLEIAFERGLVGLAGLAFLLLGMSMAALQRRDAGVIVVILAALLANVFDYTFFFGGVIYPLAAVAGWRSGRRAAPRGGADSLARRFVVRMVLASMDLVLAWAAMLVAWHLVELVGGGRQPGALGLTRYTPILWPVMAWREGLYPGYGLTEPDELRRQVWGAATAGVILLAGSVVLGPEFGVRPVIVVATTVLSIPALSLGRATIKRVLHGVGLWGRPVVILGVGPRALQVAQTLVHRYLDGLRPVGLFGRREALPADPSKRGSVPYRGPISAANAFASREGIHHAIVVVDSSDPSVHIPKLNPADDAFTLVQYVPDLPGLPVLGVRAGTLDNLLALEVRNELASSTNRAVKRTLDIAGTVVVGLLFSPVLLALAAAVALDSRGPIFFRHTRIGRNGRRIKVWKFRTMVKDAAIALERHLDANPELRAEWDAHHKLKNDPRVTRVGRILRRYSLDEVPQLWNVLKGDMSLVGPRPIVDDEIAKYADAFDLYTMVRPGMTGYWQISGRSDTDYEERVELDSFYVRNWSVWLDIVVLIKTVSVVLKRDGAY